MYAVGRVCECVANLTNCMEILSQRGGNYAERKGYINRR
jgi:hypothetical protein